MVAYKVALLPTTFSTSSQSWGHPNDFHKAGHRGLLRRPLTPHTNQWPVAIRHSTLAYWGIPSLVAIGDQP